MQGMTKRERQVTDGSQILHILDTAKILHLGLCADNVPYVVPMNYGYTMEQGKLTLYLHSAVRGKKLEILRENPTVFFEMNCDLILFDGTGSRPDHRRSGGKAGSDDAPDEDPVRQRLFL